MRWPARSRIWTCSASRCSTTTASRRSARRCGSSPGSTRVFLRSSGEIEEEPVALHPPVIGARRRRLDPPRAGRALRRRPRLGAVGALRRAARRPRARARGRRRRRDPRLAAEAAAARLLEQRFLLPAGEVQEVVAELGELAGRHRREARPSSATTTAGASAASAARTYSSGRARARARTGSARGAAAHGRAASSPSSSSRLEPSAAQESVELVERGRPLAGLELLQVDARDAAASAAAALGQPRAVAQPGERAARARDGGRPLEAPTSTSHRPARRPSASGRGLSAPRGRARGPDRRPAAA